MINLISTVAAAIAAIAAEAGLWPVARATVAGLARARAVVVGLARASAVGLELASALRAIAGPEPASAPSAGRAAVSLGRAAANPEDKPAVCVRVNYN